jgi:putative nucleotidyltransferase with HDIG domain
MTKHVGKILVVDDDESICKLCETSLRQVGYGVATTSSAIDACQMVKNDSYDLILTDIKMPRMDGMELMREIKTVSPDKAVIFMTAYPTLDMAVDAVREGAYNFINKPFSISEMVLAVNNAFERQKLIQENIRLKTLVGLFQASEKIGRTSDPAKLLDLVLTTCLVETESQRAAIFYYDKTIEELYIKHAIGDFPDAIIKLDAYETDGLIRFVFNTSNLLIANSFKLRQYPLPAAWERELGLHALILPINNATNKLGVLALFRDISQPYQITDRDFASILTTQAGTALDNVELILDQEIFFLETMMSLASTIDARDTYTHGHSRRVSAIAAAVGRKMMLSMNEVEEVKIAGLLHDIGKIGVQDSILRKKAPLTTEEYEIIKTHPEKGFQILRHIQRLSNVVQAVYAHHEWYNGKGYPRKLSRNDIPVYSQILTIADVFDALTSGRPYREKISYDNAREIIRKYSKVQFHPDVVDIFVSFSNDELAIILNNGQIGDTSYKG